MTGEVRQTLRLLINEEIRRRVWESGVRPCARCGEEFEAERAVNTWHRRYCSDNCRKRDGDWRTQNGRDHRNAMKRQWRARQRALLQEVAA